MNWLDAFTANMVFYAAGRNRFHGTASAMRALPTEDALREAKRRLFRDALERARRRGEVGESDYWAWRVRLEGD